MIVMASVSLRLLRVNNTSREAMCRIHGRMIKPRFNGRCSTKTESGHAERAI